MVKFFRACYPVCQLLDLQGRIIYKKGHKNMGFKLSRLAQAVMAAVICSSTCLAAERTDDFYIEIKGPDSKVQQSVPQVLPSRANRPVTERIPQPYVPENTGKPVFSATSEFYGPVKTTDTMWSIANSIKQLYPRHNLSNQKIMNALHRKNPQAFAGRSVESLLAGSRLAIPSLSEISTTNIRPVSKKTAVVALAKNEDLSLISKPQTPPPSVIEKKEETIATSSTTAAAASPMVNSTVVASTEPALVDSKVTALVEGGAVAATTAASTAKPSVETPVVAPVNNSELLVYQTENKELKDKIQQLNEQIGHLQANMQNQEELKQELDTLQAQLKEHETAKPKLEEQKPDETIQDGSSGSFWHDIMSTPLNLLLLISLPVLAILVVLSFWLRSRAKRQMAAREQEMAETTTLMMDDASSDFGELLAVDLSDNEQSFPDLNLEDESLIPTTITSEQADKDLDAALQDISISADILPEIADEEPYIQQTEIDLNADEVSHTASTDDKSQDFSMILSDADLASALEDNFSFSATDNESENDDLESFNVDLSESSENTPIDVASQLNLDKLMADPGVKMSDQLVSEVTGWEVSADDQSSDLVSATQSNVNLKEVNDDSNKPWLQQFENDQLKTENETVIPDDYLSIDELLAQADKQDSATLTNPDSMQPNLDIGLDEFPDMLPEHDGIDIDEDGGVGAKMDLARAYLEIDDKASAKELLLEVQAQGNSSQIKEAEKLLSRIA
jgi:pilus assembly protein FimV